MHIQFLAASNTEGNVDRLILLKQIPLDLHATLHVIRRASGNNVQETRYDVENTTVEVAPSNYLENEDQYLLHVIERADLNRLTVYLYKIERNEFRSIRKFITSLSSIKEKVNVA